jgi:hypothetical protein
MYASVEDILRRLADISVSPMVDFETVQGIYTLLSSYYKETDSSVATSITSKFDYTLS